MSISRPLLLAVLGALLMGATFFTALNARERTVDEPTPTAQTQDPAADPQPAGELTPSEALQAALSFDELESARFRGSLSIRARGPEAQSVNIEATGKFQAGAKGEVPRVELDVRGRGLAQGLDAGFVSLGDRAYFTRGEVGYAIPRDVWQKLVKALGQRGSAAAAASSPPLPFDPSGWLRDVKSERGERIDGVETMHLSASLDPARIVRDLIQASGQASQQGQGAPALPPGLDGMVAKAVKRADLELFVGAEDKILRRVTFALDMAVPRELRGAATGVQSARLAFDFELGDVNRPQAIERPKRVSRNLPGGAFGGFISGFTQGLSVATGTSPEELAVPTNDNPHRLQRAVREHRKVVLFFRQPRGLDDQAAAEAVRALAGRRGVLVLRDQVSSADRYGSLVEDLGVSQAPAIVIVDRRGNARLIEGYVDAQLLAQEVADAR